MAFRGRRLGRRLSDSEVEFSYAAFVYWCRSALPTPYPLSDRSSSFSYWGAAPRRNGYAGEERSTE